MTMNKLKGESVLWLLVLFFCIINVASAERILLYDDFSDGLDPIWKARNWGLPVAVDDGTGTGNKIINQSSIGIYAGDAEWIDYEVEIEFRITSDAFYTLFARLRYDRDNEPVNYQPRIIYTGPQYGRVVYQLFYNNKVVDAATVTLGTATTPLEVFGTEWHKFAVRIVGNYITAYLDGEELSTVEVEPYALKGNTHISYDRHGGTTGNFCQLNSIKVTDLSPEISANPQVIAADGIMDSTINVNWIPGGKVRVKGTGSTMTDPFGTLIDEVVISLDGNTSFKIKGTVAGQLPLEASLDGIYWWEPLPDQKAIMFVPVANPSDSTMYIPDFQEGQKFPAAGEEYPVTVKVNLVDYDAEDIGIPGKHKVSLVQSNGDSVSISNSVILNGDGEATFNVTSTKSGEMVLEARVVSLDENGDPISGISPVILSAPLKIVFTQAINPTKSKIIF